MHIQSHFEQQDIHALHELIRTQPLGALVLQGPEGLEVNHMPFLLLPHTGERGVLQAHVPIGNVIRTYPEQEAVVLFQGPQAYVSPSWYTSKREHADYLATMLDRLVGIEIPITRLIGKWKVSQNRPGDRDGISAELDHIGTDATRAMAALVRGKTAD
jgi:transcriptional regulator